MKKEELRVMENSKELWDKEPTDNGQRSTRLNAEEGYTCNLKQTSLPKKEAFTNTLTGEIISEEDHAFANEVWTFFGCQSMKQYLELYELTDVI